MHMQGSVKFNAQRGNWYLALRWQGQRKYFSQIPTRGDEWLECKTEEMACHLQREISREIDRGVFHPARWQRSRPLRFESYVTDWLQRQGHIRHATLCGYRQSIRNHLIPAIGSKFIGDISHADYEDLYASLKLAPKSKKNVLTVLFKVLEDARRAGVLAQVPERLRFDGPRSIPQKEIKWIDPATFERVMSKLPTRHQPIFRFVFLTGVRLGEARALQWRDIRDDHILISRAWVHGNGKAELATPKNRRIQPIPLSDAVAELLESVRKNQLMPCSVEGHALPQCSLPDGAEKATDRRGVALPLTVEPVLKPGHGISEWVFINPEYNRPYSHMLPRIWNPACKAALGYTIPCYNLRHSFANTLLAGGVDLETVSRLLRHSSTAITQEHYGRPHLQILKQAVDNVQRMK